MFKVIQKFDANGSPSSEFLIVPEALEKNGVFWYPPSSWSSKKINQTTTNCHSHPDKLNWDAGPCILKISNIETYSLAEDKEDELVESFVASLDDTLNSDRCHQSNSCIRISEILSATEFDDINCKPQFSTPYHLSHPHNDALPQTQNIRYESAETAAPAPAVSCNNDSNVANEVNLVSLINTVIENQKTIMKNASDMNTYLTNEIKGLHKLITTGLSKVSAQIDFLEQHQTVPMVVSTESSDKSTSSSLFSPEKFEKIATFEAATNLNTLLENHQYQTDMIQKMAYVVGRGGRRIGHAMCSWTGASTQVSISHSKIRFCSFENIILCFSKIIINADPDYSLHNVHAFLKRILRNSTRFASQEATQQRKSVMRRRPLNIKRKTKGDPPNKKRVKKELSDVPVDDENSLDWT